jgi:hypothetical protein
MFWHLSSAACRGNDWVLLDNEYEGIYDETCYPVTRLAGLYHLSLNLANSQRECGGTETRLPISVCSQLPVLEETVHAETLEVRPSLAADR